MGQIATRASICNKLSIHKIASAHTHKVSFAPNIRLWIAAAIAGGSLHHIPPDFAPASVTVLIIETRISNLPFADLATRTNVAVVDETARLAALGIARIVRLAVACTGQSLLVTETGYTFAFPRRASHTRD
jgi:hypothetical protein